MNYLIPRKGGGEGVGAVAFQHIATIHACLHLDNFLYCYVSQKSWGVGNPQKLNKYNKFHNANLHKMNPILVFKYKQND